MSKPNFSGLASALNAGDLHEQYWRESFRHQRELLLAQPDNGETGVNKSAPSFLNLIRLLEGTP